ncbi:MAG: hypothetical protein H7141_09415 [Burkholderiales bacterium]|nr:hypothetical protein [Bacteroidia bacterium]
MTIGDLKQNFRDNFGLTIELFQKTEDRSWRKIPVTEKVILDELNKETKYLNNSILK